MSYELCFQCKHKCAWQSLSDECKTVKIYFEMEEKVMNNSLYKPKMLFSIRLTFLSDFKALALNILCHLIFPNSLSAATRMPASDKYYYSN